MSKGKLAIYWAASCGGCEIAVLSINEKILDVVGAFDLVFCPCVVDGKVSDIEAMEDGEIDVCLFNGGIRTSENEYMAHLLRKKSKALIAFGACSGRGGIPGLANSTTVEKIFKEVYHDGPSTENPDGVQPKPHSTYEGCELHLPVIYDRLRALDQVTNVDYYLPGCPPEAPRIWDAITAILSGELPPPGAVNGAPASLCDECERKRDEKRIKRFYRTWEIIPDEETCLLEQGLLCNGVATRMGCGALCPQVNQPCIGCYGPAEGVKDTGARMISALASVIDSRDPEEIDRIIEEGIPDPVGTFYRFGLPTGLMRGGAGEPVNTERGDG